MKIDHRIDFRAQTLAHFTTYTLPDEIQRLIARNRTLLADIARNAGTTIAREAAARGRSLVVGGTVDRMV